MNNIIAYQEINEIKILNSKVLDNFKKYANEEIIKSKDMAKDIYKISEMKRYIEGDNLEVNELNDVLTKIKQATPIATNQLYISTTIYNNKINTY